MSRHERSVLRWAPETELEHHEGDGRLDAVSPADDSLGHTEEEGHVDEGRADESVDPAAAPPVESSALELTQAAKPEELIGSPPRVGTNDTVLVVFPRTNTVLDHHAAIGRKLRAVHVPRPAPDSAQGSRKALPLTSGAYAPRQPGFVRARRALEDTGLFLPPVVKASDTTVAVATVDPTTRETLAARIPMHRRLSSGRILVVDDKGPLPPRASAVPFTVYEGYDRPVLLSTLRNKGVRSRHRDPPPAAAPVTAESVARSMPAVRSAVFPPPARCLGDVRPPAPPGARAVDVEELETARRRRLCGDSALPHTARTYREHMTQLRAEMR